MIQAGLPYKRRSRFRGQYKAKFGDSVISFVLNIELKALSYTTNLQVYAHLWTMTLLSKPAPSIVAVSSSNVLLGKVVPIVYGRDRFSGRALQCTQ